MQSYNSQSRRATWNSPPATQPHDLGDDALALWRLRYAIEGDALAAVAADPAALWPALVAAGVDLKHFDCPLHRGVFVIIRECHAAGRDRRTAARVSAVLGDRLGYYRDDVIDLFEKFPPSEGNVAYRARRLATVAAALGTAHQHLRQARSIVSAGLAAMALEGVAA